MPASHPKLSSSMGASATLFFVLVSSMASFTSAVTVEECKETYLPAVNECLLAGDGPCDYLPIPESAFAVNTPNELGYWLEHLRDTPSTHVFGISDGNYNGLIVVDVGPTTEVEKRQLRTEQRPGSLRGLQDFPIEMSEDEDADTRAGSGAITFGLVDFTENFYIYGEDGSIVGYMMIEAMQDILDMLNATMSDVVDVEMIYSHAHFDHIGAANYTYNALMELGFENIDIIASAGTLHHLEELIEAGVSSYRAPLPTTTFYAKLNHTIGQSSAISMEPVNGHQFDKRDVLIFVPSGGGDDQPAIMYLVDILAPKWSPFYSFAITADLLAYTQLHDKMLFEYDLGDGYFLGGHITQTGSRMDIEANKNLTVGVIKNAGTALSTVDFGGLVSPVGIYDSTSTNFGNTWLAFDTYLRGVHKECARLTIEQFGCTFAGLDVFAESLCAVAQFYLRVDI